MPIPVACTGCGKRFQAPDRGAGKRVPCPSCQTTISIPAHYVPAEEEEYRLAEEEPRPAPPPVRPVSVMPAAAPPPPVPRAIPSSPRPAPAPAAPAQHAPPPGFSPPPAGATAHDAALESAPGGWVPPTKSSTPTWLRHLHWCLALATIPLAISIFLPGESNEELIARILSSIKAEQTASEPAADSPTESEPETATDDSDLEELLGYGSIDDLLMSLPGRKIQGAFLARDSSLHWLFALVSVAAYMTFFVFLASDNSAKAWHLLAIGTFTATIGILLLVIVQVLAMIGGGRGILGLIALSYTMALDPEMGFIPSFIGFTLGVGLCEELCKALPLLIYYKIGNRQNWRGAFLWGLASGAGFGVSEGIMYSGDYYNGITGPGIYLVRFVSCVALHAIWTGSVGIAINQRQYVLHEEQEHWAMYALGILQMIAVPMVLHGLYDTLLKKDMNFLALATAAASFGYLAWQISRLRTSDDEDERAAYVGQYIRSRIAEAGGQG
ncbi:MAG TPA: PrsW family glutamic-type intramembrane protease [Pirellulaceae bacterium]|nr:PrsW family glutamic-type intramembrane protease [Pirellulaceae bacterium]